MMDKIIEKARYFGKEARANGLTQVYKDDLAVDLGFTRWGEIEPGKQKKIEAAWWDGWRIENSHHSANE